MYTKHFPELADNYELHDVCKFVINLFYLVASFYFVGICHHSVFIISSVRISQYISFA